MAFWPGNEVPGKEHAPRRRAVFAIKREDLSLAAVFSLTAMGRGVQPAPRWEDGKRGQ